MRVLNFGSLNIDHVYKVDHIVVPGETISSDSLKFAPGGKGLNQSIALARSGVETYHVGCIGNDGDMLLKQLKQAGVHTQYTTKKDTATGHAMIQVNKDGQNSILIYGGANLELTREMVDAVLDEAEKPDMVLLQNETSQVHYIAEACRNRGIPVAFNPSPYSNSLKDFPYEAIQYLLINETEGNQITEESTPEKIAASLMSQYPEMRVVLTLGSKGVYYQDKKMSSSHNGFRVQAVDTTGAGDTFTGFFLGSILKGTEVGEALRWGCGAAALSVTKSGAALSIPEMEEVRQFLAEELGKTK